MLVKIVSITWMIDWRTSLFISAVLVDSPATVAIGVLVAKLVGLGVLVGFGVEIGLLVDEGVPP